MTVRSFGASVLLLAVISAAACGGSDDDDAAAASASGSSTEGRTVVHDQGETVVPEQAERVVVLDTPQLDAALSLGVTPVGATRPATGAGFPEYLEGADDIADVGTIETPNLEAIAELEPDLILSSSVRHEDLYDELSQITATVFSETTGGSWKDDYLLFADALGRQADAEAALEEYETRAEAVGAQLGDPAAETVGVVRFLPDEIRVYGPDSFSGSVLTDVGVQLPEAVRDVHDDIAIYPSAEQVDQASADVIYVTTWGDPADTTKGSVQAGPLWAMLPAVQQGRVYEVSDDVWMLGIGVLGANAVLDDIEATL
jgi:iron complex transport system substrate-binding protein